MLKTSSVSLKIAIGLLFLMGIINIVLSYISLTEPVADHSEFAALKNVAMGLYALLIAILSILMIISNIFLLKKKRWAYILNIILVILIFLLLEVSDFKHVLLLNISVNKEILPFVTLVMLVLGFKVIWKK